MYIEYIQTTTDKRLILIHIIFFWHLQPYSLYHLLSFTLLLPRCRKLFIDLVDFHLLPLVDGNAAVSKLMFQGLQPHDCIESVVLIAIATHIAHWHMMNVLVRVIIHIVIHSICFVF